jgi:signal transduction histidine kinase
VLNNLLNNALKHMGDVDEPGVEVSIERTAADRVRVDVHDNGKGLAPALEPSIFEPYVRGNTSAPGLGLGLATVKRVVEGHGGHVGVRSIPGHGCTFLFELPIAGLFADTPMSSGAAPEQA